MVRYLDCSADINPATKKSWLSQTETVFNGLKVRFQWVNKQKNEGWEKLKGTCLHWSAGHYNTVNDGYHYNIVFDSATGEAYVIRLLDWDDKAAHLWKRNSHMVGITLCSMATDNVKTHYKQILLGAQLNAELCAWRQIDPRGKMNVPEMKANYQATSMVATGKTISVPTVWDHAGWAQVDSYGRFRWDARLPLTYLSAAERALINKELGLAEKKKSFDFSNQTVFDLYYALTLKYYDDLKSGNRQFEFKDIL